VAVDQAAVICQVGRCTPIEALENQYRQLEYVAKPVASEATAELA